MTADFLDPTLTERRYSARPRISAPIYSSVQRVATFVSNGDAQRVRSLRPTRPPLHLFALGAASAATSLSWRHGMTTQRYSGTYFRAIGPT
jgi:hypothetical protein